MPKFRIPCFWQMHGYYDIEADNIQGAIEEAKNAPLPEHQDYLDGSFEIDFEFLGQHNEGPLVGIAHRHQNGDSFMIDCVCGHSYTATISRKMNCRGIETDGQGLVTPECPACRFNDMSTNLLQKPS